MLFNSIFECSSQFRGYPGLGNNKRKRICPLFWKQIALKKDEFQSSGPQTKVVSSASKIQSGVGRYFAPTVLATGTSFRFLLQWSVTCLKQFLSNLL